MVSENRVNDPLLADVLKPPEDEGEETERDEDVNDLGLDRPGFDNQSCMEGSWRVA